MLQRFSPSLQLVAFIHSRNVGCSKVSSCMHCCHTKHCFYCCLEQKERIWKHVWSHPPHKNASQLRAFQCKDTAGAHCQLCLSCYQQEGKSSHRQHTQIRPLLSDKRIKGDWGGRDTGLEKKKSKENSKHDSILLSSKEKKPTRHPQILYQVTGLQEPVKLIWVSKTELAVSGR